MGQYLTLSRENKFEFTCPVFNANTRMAACIALRERVWMGRPPEKRQGCQVAMRCGMCPAATIVDRIGRLGQGKEPTSDDYGSLEQKHGRLHASILERIKNTIPIQSVLDKAPITPEERQMLLTSRQRIAEQLKTAPGRDGRSTPYIAPRKTDSSFAALQSVGRRGRDDSDRDQVDLVSVAPKPQSAQESAISRAAKSGDMAAAINAAAA